MKYIFLIIFIIVGITSIVTAVYFAGSTKSELIEATYVGLQSDRRIFYGLDTTQLTLLKEQNNLTIKSQNNEIVIDLDQVNNTNNEQGKNQFLMNFIGDFNSTNSSLLLPKESCKTIYLEVPLDTNFTVTNILCDL